MRSDESQWINICNWILVNNGAGDKDAEKELLFDYSHKKNYKIPLLPKLFSIVQL